jgi:hypothetical protein
LRWGPTLQPKQQTQNKQALSAFFQPTELQGCSCQFNAAAEDETDIFIQELHTIQGKVIGISIKYKIFTSGKDRCRAAVVATNNQIDAMLIHQLSDADMVAVEITKGNTKIIAASTYFDRKDQIEHDLIKTESVLHHTKNRGVLIASDRNARSTLWHDKLTNRRGRILEEFITSKQLYILNEESCNTTFRNRLGTSNIDLTVINPQLLNSITGWVISDQESVSHHSIIKYAIKSGIAKWHSENPSHIRYRTNKESLAEFQGTILQVLRKKFKINHNTTRDEDLNNSLSSLLTEGANIEKLVDEFNEALTMACNKTFQIHRASRNAPSHRSVPNSP